ncbi:MAG: hypothetical protein HYU66_28030, partial [Armatimonadetes bacterium]|nr:hypothetical protein [Armatimonadota bacterium]
RTEIKRTTYTPADNQREGVAGKETVETEEYDGPGSARAGGVPGTGANLFGEAKLPAGAAGGQGRYTRNKSDRDYMVNQQQEVIVKPGGGLKRISLGIFVDESLSGDKNKVESVARSAAGLDSQRGDTISVEAVKFSPSSTDALNGVGRADMVRNIARLVLNALAMIIGLLTFRSILGALKPAPTVGGFQGGPELSHLGSPVPLLTDGGAPHGLPALTSPSAALTGMSHPTGATPMDHNEGPGLTLPRDLSGRDELPLLDAPMDVYDDDLVVPVATGPTPEEMIGRVETAIIDDIAEVLRHWLEGDLNE